MVDIARKKRAAPVAPAKPRSRLEISVPELRRRLGDVELPKPSKAVVKHALERIGADRLCDVDYLVVGNVKSALLGLGPKTATQKKAEALNTKGARIAIIGEDEFFELRN